VRRHQPGRRFAEGAVESLGEHRQEGGLDGVVEGAAAERDRALLRLGDWATSLTTRSRSF
jgi:hypothetical protein